MLFSHLLHMSTCSIITRVTDLLHHCLHQHTLGASVSHHATTSAITLLRDKGSPMMGGCSLAVLLWHIDRVYELLSAEAERHAFVFCTLRSTARCVSYWPLEQRGGYIIVYSRSSTWCLWLPEGPKKNIWGPLNKNWIFCYQCFAVVACMIPFQSDHNMSPIAQPGYRVW